MKKKRADGVREDGNPRTKRRFGITSSAAVLLVLLVIAFNTGKGGSSFLFDKNSPVTLYVKTRAGVKPDLNAADYFPEADLDSLKFSYDWENCDLNQPGTYDIPVSYGGKRTVCVVSLTVQPAESKKVLPDGKTGENGDGTGIENLPDVHESEAKENPSRGKNLPGEAALQERSQN